MSILKDAALGLFGWIPIGEKFVRDGTEYIAICIKERGVDAGKLNAAANLALSQLAYTRAAERDAKRVPRWRNYVREMEAVSGIAAQALSGRDVSDERVRSILMFHHVL